MPDAQVLAAAPEQRKGKHRNKAYAKHAGVWAEGLMTPCWTGTVPGTYLEAQEEICDLVVCVGQAVQLPFAPIDEKQPENEPGKGQANQKRKYSLDRTSRSALKMHGSSIRGAAGSPQPAIGCCPSAIHFDPICEVQNNVSGTRGSACCPKLARSYHVQTFTGHQQGRCGISGRHCCMNG